MRRILELDRDALAPAQARGAVDAIAGTLDAEIVAPAKLLLSELVTNSVRHGSGDRVRVLLDARRPGRLRCEIVDAGSGFVPTARDRPATDEGGWGLHLVESMAEAWGVYEGSTHVWFELST
jgi:anti-sigma regulatory factor (Ser/Thr protein kinase)